MSNATYTIPDPDGSFIIEGVGIKPQGASSGQTLVYDNASNSFIPGANNGTILGSIGANGQIPFSTTTANTVTSSSIFVWDNSNTRLGIGTSLPSYEIHTIGDGYFTSRLMLKGSTASVSPTGSRRY